MIFPWLKHRQKCQITTIKVYSQNDPYIQKYLKRFRYFLGLIYDITKKKSKISFVKKR